VRKTIKGIETIILRQDEDGGFVSVDAENLTKKMEELFTEENLLAIEADMPTGFRKMPLVAVIKSDIANKDRMGWRQHQKVLKEDGYDV